MDEYLAGIMECAPVEAAAPEPFVFIVLPGDPRGKGRPRTRVIGEYATIYTDAETRKYENKLKSAGIKAMAGKIPLDEAVSVVIHAHFPVPASWSAKKRAAALAGDIAPTGKPDWENICKCCDGLNYYPPRFKGDREKRPIVWRDDSQIVAAQFLKLYSANPRLEITVWKWEG
jgi:Holliday junction resolvase RusA-like endonuclease